MDGLALLIMVLRLRESDSETVDEQTASLYRQALSITQQTHNPIIHEKIATILSGRSINH
jgi:hypothetical protein